MTPSAKLLEVRRSAVAKSCNNLGREPQRAANTLLHVTPRLECPSHNASCKGDSDDRSSPLVSESTVVRHGLARRHKRSSVLKVTVVPSLAGASSHSTSQPNRRSRLGHGGRIAGDTITTIQDSLHHYGEGFASLLDINGRKKVFVRMLVIPELVTQVHSIITFYLAAS